MKNFLSCLSLLCLLTTGAVNANEIPPADTARSVILNLSSNGYIYSQERSSRTDNISEKGLVNWKDPAISTRTWFWPQVTGKISVAVRLKSPSGNSTIRVRLDNSGEAHEIVAGKTDLLADLPAGDFEITSAGYHFIEISGISKAGKYFPDIEALVISGPASENVKFNSSIYRGAPSTHLRYEAPKDSSIAWFYTEVSVPEGVNATNAYYETNGFADGYMGIQVNSPTERRFIFSIWSNYRTDNPKEIPAEYAVRLLKKGKDVYSDQFGNEGSGGHTHLVFPWKNGQTYKLLVGAKPAGDHTIYTAWYFAPENKSWRLISQWDKTKTGGKLLSSLYAFVENFGPNGNDYFKADYGNQWICTPSGTWIELTRCMLTTTANPVKHPRFDYGAGVENNRFYMYSGGFRQLNNLPARSWIQREPNGIKPDIDFSTLPQE